ncbi:DNA-directed RNA polymerase subunit alpha [Methanosarcinales archaeon]|nr:MAG: DNA-directed RNA polymerase subunit alpha [Methanosarcinales archaeon]
MEKKDRDFVMPHKVECDEESLTDSYGKFIVQPLERGYGITLGNSLRRILLSSLPGAAVRNIKIQGVLHEFSTIPGVLEDVSEIIMNIKKLILKLHSSQPRTIKIEVKKEGKVTARNIIKDEFVEILNPDLHIATLSSKAEFNLEMEVLKGRGYLPAEQNKKENKTIGIIEIDSIFTPVRKVNYRVENARVKQITNYDKLILEIWTNSAISAEEALIQGAKIFQKHLDIFVNYGQETEEEKEEEHLEHLEEELSKPISDLELSVRSSRCLEGAGINTIGDLVKKTEDEMLRYKNFGKKSFAEIKEVLQKMGLSLHNGRKCAASENKR